MGPRASAHSAWEGPPPGHEEQRDCPAEGQQEAHCSAMAGSSAGWGECPYAEYKAGIKTAMLLDEIEFRNKEVFNKLPRQNKKEQLMKWLQDNPRPLKPSGFALPDDEDDAVPPDAAPGAAAARKPKKFVENERIRLYHCIVEEHYEEFSKQYHQDPRAHKDSKDNTAEDSCWRLVAHTFNGEKEFINPFDDGNSPRSNSRRASPSPPPLPLPPPR